MKKVAVAVLNWNGKELLEQYLPSVVKHSIEADVIVVDNNSTDDSLSFLKTTFPEIEVLETGSNSGYAGGYNIALEKIKHEYIVLLNSDVEVTEGWLAAQLALFESDMTIGACQPKVKAYKQKTHFEYAGAAGGYLDVLGYPFCRGRIFETLEEDLGQFNDSREVFWASGACLMVRRDAFIKAGKLDELFFAHMEEIDLCWRMKNSGYKIMYCAGSTIYHLGGATLDSQSPQKTFLNFRNSLFMLFKNLPTIYTLPVIFARLILDGVAGVKFIFSLKFKHTIAILHAHFSFYFHFFKLAKERQVRMISNPPKGYKLSGFYKRNIVLDHYLFKKETFSSLTGKFTK